MPPKENKEAINNWVNWLNTTFPPVGWVPIEGYNAMVKLDFGFNGSVIFNGNAGYPLKGFVNVKTGEVKIFDGRKFIAQ